MHIFITRDLAPDSEFLKRLSGRGWTVTGQSLVQLTPLPVTSIPVADWIFFSSQHAVAFFFDAIQLGGMAMPDARWAAVGQATANVLGRYVPVVDFTGSGDPVAAAAAFLTLCRNQRVLFPGAKNSRQSIQKAVAGQATIINLDIYDNTPIPDAPIPDADVLVFTSPLNVQAYFSQKTIQPHQKIIAIGHSTAAALQALNIHNVSIPTTPDEASLANLILGQP
jgi:uroporphyrinogen-III synthase